MQCGFKAISTVYKGVKLKSRLEGDIAYLIDNLGYIWRYEPQSYKLSNGYDYLPDFYVPELKLFIECRGYENGKGDKQIKGFAEMIINGEIGPNLVERPPVPTNCEFPYSDVYNDYVDFMVIGPDNIKFYECLARFGIGESDDVSLVQCDRCERWFFVGMSGSYQCRFCGRWDGDHHFIECRWLEYEEGILYIGYRKERIKEFIQSLKFSNGSSQLEVSNGHL